MKKFIAIYILLAAILPAAVFAQVQRSAAFHDKYQLKEVVVLSRHNIRSPLSTNGSALSTPRVADRKINTWNCRKRRRIFLNGAPR